MRAKKGFTKNLRTLFESIKEKAGIKLLEFCFAKKQEWDGALTQGPVLSSWPFAWAAAFVVPSALSAANTRLLLTTCNCYCYISISIFNIIFLCQSHEFILNVIKMSLQQQQQTIIEHSDYRNYLADLAHVLRLLSRTINTIHHSDYWNYLADLTHVISRTINNCELLATLTIEIGVICQTSHTFLKSSLLNLSKAPFY